MKKMALDAKDLAYYKGRGDFHYTPLFTHPAPSIPAAVPEDFDAWSRGCKIQLLLCHSEFREVAEFTWNEACRAAMLQSGTLTNEGTMQSDGWISCSERLPPEEVEEDGGDVCYLVWHKRKVECGPQYSISNVFFLRKHWEDWFTHWKPLPAPPKP